MHVLIAVASKHGATSEIAEALRKTLKEQGIDTSIFYADGVTTLTNYSAVVLGSAVYAGRWLKAARSFADRYQEELRKRPVWLFSSGPIGNPPKPVEEATDVRAIAEMVRAKGRRTFSGLLDRKHLSFVEKALVSAVHAPEGDFRNWQDVSEWAEEIASNLLGLAPAADQVSR